jgi:hypothetical protein
MTDEVTNISVSGGCMELLASNTSHTGFSILSVRNHVIYKVLTECYQDDNELYTAVYYTLIPIYMSSLVLL